VSPEYLEARRLLTHVITFISYSEQGIKIKTMPSKGGMKKAKAKPKAVLKRKTQNKGGVAAVVAEK